MDDKTTPTSEESPAEVRRREKKHRRFVEARHQMGEQLVWFLFAVLAAFPIVLDIALNDSIPFAEVLSVRIFHALLAVLLFFFPVLYQLIFGMLPFETLRRRFERRREIRDDYTSSDTSGTLPVFESETDLSSQRSEELLATFAMASARVAKSIYSRAGVYLLIGVLVAFSGLGFFYLATTTRTLAAENLTDRLLELAPQFGILFFIEFIAFFFLRQYRSAMDEFRYYEAVQRRREELLALVRISSESDQSVDLAELLKQGMYYSTAGKLSVGESTEILETRKLEKDEVELFQRIVETVGKAKK